MIRIAPRPHHESPRILRSLTLAISLSLTSLSAGLAQDRPVALDPPRLAQAPEPLCFCWTDGLKIAEGASACIRTTVGRRLAKCDRVTNVMSWQVTENPCPES
ncbi:hypothetical protein DWF00_17630 [Bosea caraganae]|uniref:Uncharacterized protein n=1 Tax=Bosea caraganae TaxID=2763117 RepID=A0A370L7W3_9HYPH|nr:hypothetical protein DWF00_17630 [Bosea caraganae]RDJ26135.1 hypothetical protein DWE98_09850 [Bosea caraganae]